MDLSKHIRQIGYLIRSTISLRRLVLNRITLTLLIIVLGIALVQGYIATNGGGTIEGQVVDSEGEPIEDATVELEQVDIRVTRSVDSTTTDSDGRFQFQNSEIIEFNLVASHEQHGSTESLEHRYYTDQNVEVTLVLEED